MREMEAGCETDGSYWLDGMGWMEEPRAGAIESEWELRRLAGAGAREKRGLARWLWVSRCNWFWPEQDVARRVRSGS